MTEAYIVDAVRTATGKRGGGHAETHPVDLAAAVIKEIVDRNKIDPELVDDVILGSVAQIGSQAWNIARNAWLSAGFPTSVPGVTIDRQCGSSQQAVQFAAASIKAGDYDLAIVGGVEVMSRVPLNSSGVEGAKLGFGYPFDGQGWTNRFGEEEIHQLRGGDLIADRWGITDEEMRELAFNSHQRAHRAWEEGRFDREVLALNGVERDETIRPGTTLEKMETLEPNREGGRHTAALSSSIADGASAMMIASEKAVKEYGLTPRARIVGGTVVGSDPVLILSGPIPATQKLLVRTGMSLDDMDLCEVNEAFAAVVLAWAKETGADLEKTNVNGGAMALGHALGSSGTRLMTTMLHELERTGGRYGFQTMCEGGGLANATIIERL